MFFFEGERTFKTRYYPPTDTNLSLHSSNTILQKITPDEENEEKISPPRDGFEAFTTDLNYLKYIPVVA